MSSSLVAAQATGKPALKPYLAATRVEDGLRVVSFLSNEGAILVYLPGDIQPGDTISGTVVATTEKGELKPFKDLQLQVAEINGTVISPFEPKQRWEIPKDPGLKSVIVRLRGFDGNELSQLTVPLTVPSSRISEVNFPRTVQAGTPIRVTGPFDGNSANTLFRMNGESIPILAESPRGFLVRTPSVLPIRDLPVTATENNLRASGRVEVGSINLTADKTFLRAGESAIISVHLECSLPTGTTAPHTLFVRNLSPNVVDLEGKTEHEILVPPPATSGNWVFDRKFTVTAKSEGAYSISARLDTGQTNSSPVTAVSVGQVVPTSSVPSVPETVLSTRPNLSGWQPATSLASVRLFNSTVFPDLTASKNGPCDEELLRLFDLLQRLAKSLGDAQGGLNDNDLVKEARLYDAIAKLLANREELEKAIQAFINGKIQEFLNSVSDPWNALENMDRLLGFFQSHSQYFSDGERKAVEVLRSRLQVLLQKKSQIDDLKGELQKLFDDLKSLTENPLEFLESKLKEGLESLVEKMVGKAVGNKAAGPIIGMAKDIANLIDALLKQNTIDDLRKQIDALRQKIYDRASQDPCFRIDAEWNTRMQPYLWFSGTEWSRAKIKVTPKLLCWNEATQKYELCEDSGILIDDSLDKAKSSETFVPALDADSVWKMEYKLDASKATPCGKKCLVLLEVEYVKADGKAGRELLLVGALP